MRSMQEWIVAPAIPFPLVSAPSCDYYTVHVIFYMPGFGTLTTSYYDMLIMGKDKTLHILSLFLVSMV